VRLSCNSSIRDARLVPESDIERDNARLLFEVLFDIKALLARLVYAVEGGDDDGEEEEETDED
jgi:hypothetical protein